MPETAIRVLPYTYRDVRAAASTTVTLSVASDLPATAWTLRCYGNRWTLHRGAVERPTGRVTVAPDASWRLFFNALPTGDVPSANAAL